MKKQYSLKFAGILKYLLATLFAYLTTTAFGQGEWVQKADLLEDKRSMAVGFSINSKGYIGLGKTGSNSYTNDFWEYDPLSDSWTQKATYPGFTRTNAVGFSSSSLGYIGTGRDNNGSPLAEFYQYNPAFNIWIQKADFPYAADSAVGFALGSYGYMGLGSGPSGAVNSFYFYNPATDSWSAIKNFPSKRLGAFGFSIDTLGYICTADSSNNFYRYSPSTNNWTQKVDFPGGIQSNKAAFVLNKKGYALTTVNGFWEYDPSNDSWDQMQNFQGTTRKNAVGFSIGSKGYIGTGLSNSSHLDDFWEYARQDTFVANFVAPNICFADSASFIDHSTSTDSTMIVQWKWNFGDGDTSMLQHTKHLYAFPGNYMVKLVVTDNLQNKDSITKNISVYDTPLAEFTYSHTDTFTIKLLNGSTGAGEYFWQFGDNNISTSANPTHTYTTIGIYQVCLSGYNFNGCEGKICKNINLASIGINEVQASNNSFKIYPNPASNSVFLSANTFLNEKTTVRIVDGMGKTSLIKSIEKAGSYTEQINIENLSSGFYVMEMENGSTITRLKLVVK
ncbi:MAG: PKD domain-containing protein [Bacteroidota bacterium]|nr:PKD domain-containing protein [Bacteroidota bacterium]